MLFCVALLLYGCYNKPKEEHVLLIETLKRGALEEAIVSIHETQQSQEIKSFLLGYVDYLRYGYDSKILLSKPPKSIETFPNAYKVMYYYMTGDIIFGLNKKVKAYDYYLKAKNLAKKENQILQNEVFVRFLGFYQKKSQHNLDFFKQYKESYLRQEHDDIDTYWIEYYTLWLRIHEEWLRKKENQKKIHEKSRFLTNMNKEEFETAFKLARNNDFFTARLYQLKGIYYSSLIEEPNKADLAFNKAKELFDNSKFFFSNKESIKAKINVAISLMRKKEYDSAVFTFKESLKSATLKKELYAKELIYSSLSNCYGELDNQSDSIYYLDKSEQIKDSVNQYVNGLVIENKEYRNQIIDGVEANEVLNQKNKMLLIFIITLLLISAFIYHNWVLSKKEKKNLEIEHEQTKEEIESIKKLVIQDRIILKNKVHVLLDELIFIKSEDHYLALNTSGKKEFIRGNISKIIKELPPNFVRCHRSYIVNINSIKQYNKESLLLINKAIIPVSRSYKKQFENFK
ncbi:LytR/AlgR family response regulator transcription factor [Tenacibaculum xiamenense]|uniref:LytR/AlgR family response regulator transcription factor n=1 Tax=Tenacibaculum xiamenense TaxID=1261553 RepID=UPI003893629E